MECKNNDYIHLNSDAGRNLQKNPTCVVSDDSETTTHNSVGDFMLYRIQLVKANQAKKRKKKKRKQRRLVLE